MDRLQEIRLKFNRSFEQCLDQEGERATFYAKVTDLIAAVLAYEALPIKSLFIMAGFEMMYSSSLQEIRWLELELGNKGLISL
ncbi:hypothetical protein ACFOQM_09685 [Paenibacillus sp. GCM10012307]|uniref:Uncharacterized protein n=1 Tax=Paenibacillus roseus TaxID=2798579 RepID=A0A934MP04_9BACL|nr:hypothetical protein [Paenibacillus roseus]MBJ6361556.1 hypothetical protein [Paenibacillus roseus]